MYNDTTNADSLACSTEDRASEKAFQDVGHKQKCSAFFYCNYFECKVTTKTPNQQPEECSLKNMNIPPKAYIVVDDENFPLN